MNRYIALMAVAVMMFGSCAKEMVAPSFGEVYADNYTDSTGVWLTGEKQTFDVEVEGDDWFVTTPTQDRWIMAYEKDGKLQVKVLANEGDAERFSHVDLRGAASSVRLNVRQDFIKYLDFAVADNLIDAADGVYRIPVRTNLSSEDIEVSTDADWLSDFTVEGGHLLMTATGNPSETESRSAEIRISSGLFEAVAFVSQVPMSGKPYVIPLSGMDLDTYPVYDVMDSETGSVIARVTREYLYKYDQNTESTYVDSTYIVVYPAFDGKVNTQKGLVADNGGEIVWADDMNLNTPGSDMVAHYAEGQLNAVPEEVYFARGATSVRVTPLAEADAASAVPVTFAPVVLNDVRGDEVFEYPVVKIAGQYWIKNNLKTACWPDGTPIPAPVTREIWTAGTTPVLKPMVMVAYGSSRYWNPFDPADSNYEKAVTCRDKYGCVYTYAAVVGATGGIELPEGSAAAFPREDKISPEGWSVPEESDYQTMINYLIQKKQITSAQKQEILMDKLCTAGSNMTGFSAQSTTVGATGTYNEYITYMTMDYSYTASVHSVMSLRMLVGNYMPMFNIGVSGGYAVRLIMK